MIGPVRPSKYNPYVFTPIAAFGRPDTTLMLSHLEKKRDDYATDPRVIWRATNHYLAEIVGQDQWR